jgi:ABC-type branched-subunit amino acid transport system substrate-binding protein
LIRIRYDHGGLEERAPETPGLAPSVRSPKWGEAVMTNRRVAAFVSFVTALALALPLVSPSAAGARTASQSGISSDEIKVGGLIETQFAQAEVGTQARFADENAKGGVNGRKFTYVTGATYAQGNTAAALAEGQRLVQQEGVAAIVPSLTSVPPTQFLTQQKIPSFGWNITPLGWDNKFYFGITGSLVAPIPKVAPGSASLPQMLSKQLKDEGKPKGGDGATIAIIGSSDASAQSGINQAKKTFEHEKYKVVYAKGAFSLTQPTTDYTPFVQEMLTSNGGNAPDITYLIASFNDISGLSKGLRQAGFEGIIVNPTTYDPRIIKAAESLEVYTQWATPEVASTVPNIQKVIDSIKKQDPEAALSLPALAAWFSADMFIQAVKAAGKNATTTSIQKAASKMTYELKGVVGPTTYPAAYTQGTSCAQLAKSNGTSFDILVGYGCYPSYVFGTGSSSKPIKTIPAPKV